MRLKNIRIDSFRRFSDLTIRELPETARLVVMVGPNGCGKSSIFDAFKMWHRWHGVDIRVDESYHRKQGLSPKDWNILVSIEFHQPIPTDANELKKLFYIRSAYRNEADFITNQLQRMRSPLVELSKIQRLIDNDASVSENYQRLVSATMESVYSGAFDTSSVKQLRDMYVGQVRDSMNRVFDGLLLKGPGDPLRDGTFFFEKGISTDFHYKNLSGGEKAAFDILLDLIIKRRDYDNTVFCIDEPETHMHTRLQARLLEELVTLIPEGCQLWIASHSLGMMRRARDLQIANPDQVVFIDFHDRDFDTQVTLTPAKIDRQFWANTLNVALDDLANLVAPQKVVLCEGRPTGAKDSAKAEFDAKCYRIIFSNEYPDTDFISVGNEADVRTDKIQVGRAIQTLIAGTTVLRVVDRDDRSPQEIADLIKEGVRVLSKRHLEAYLLDDEALTALCRITNNDDKVQAVLDAKTLAITESTARGNAIDDVKSAAGTIYVETKRILELTGCGNTTEAFLRDTMAPLIQGTAVYPQLKQDVFNE